MLLNTERRKMKLKYGSIYYLQDFTAPKMWNGLYFDCLLTGQKIPGNEKVKKYTGHNLNDWPNAIYKKQRFYKHKKALLILKGDK